MLNFFDSSGDVEAIFDDRDEIQGLYLPNMRVPVSDATSYKFSSPTTIILLGVGAEVEGKIKNKLASITINPTYVSLFYPRDLQSSLEQAEKKISDMLAPANSNDATI